MILIEDHLPKSDGLLKRLSQAGSQPWTASVVHPLKTIARNTDEIISMDVLQALATEAFTAEAFATEELATAEIEEEKARAAAALKAEAGATKASKETELEDETKARIVFRKPINHSGWDLFRLPIQQDTQGSAQNSTAGRDKAEISPTTPLQKEKFYQDVKAGRTVNSNLEANPKVPRLSLVRFHFSRPFKLSLEKEFFVDLFKHFQLNTYIFHLVSRNSYGLHRSPATENGHIDSFLLNTIIYMLAWSFNSITLETKAILMLREENGVISVEDVQTEFFRILSSFRNHIYSPKCLSTVVGIHLTHFLEKSIIDQRADIHKVEKYTGHGIAGSKEERPQMDMNKINDLSMDTGKIITVLANINRHLRVCRDITGHVKSSAGKLKKKWGKINASWIEKEKSLVEVASVLNLQLHSIQSSVVYHQDRAKAQMGVVRGILKTDYAMYLQKPAPGTTHS